MRSRPLESGEPRNPQVVGPRDFLLALRARQNTQVPRHPLPFYLSVTYQLHQDHTSEFNGDIY